MNDATLSTSQRMVLTVITCALTCLLLSIGLGALGALYYIPKVGERMADVGLSLIQLRPLHTTFASAWIYMGCVACVYAYLGDQFGEPSKGERLRFRLHMILWGVAGLASLITLLAGISSGREYLGFHPLISIPILVGWVLFGFTFMRRVASGFWGRPVYVYMWSVGVFFFVYTFLEGHAHLLPWVEARPVVDLQVQWKSCGTLVASFNQMVYGALTYFGEKKSDDKRIGQSSTGFWLFGIGLLNSFTNFAHHTYHLPQSPLIKWIAFTVSMLEIILLLKLLQEITAALRAQARRRNRPLDLASRMVGLAKRWNCFLLTLALLISVPQLNALIHGTHVVMAHAMGSELALDSYILLGVFAWILGEIFYKRETLWGFIDSRAQHRTVSYLNFSLASLVALLVIAGLGVSFTRMYGQPAPTWLESFPYLFVTFGGLVAIHLARFVWTWVPLLRDPVRHRTWAEDLARLEGNAAGPE
ncbi:MAG: hypothetical protein CMJ98_01405 [Planctomycetes bacterium]|jgi:nitric oxide reductase subunit B|nr:hypothetical protein [Planctomycetota bacterium]MBV21215.1 hypothetical protein [Planctomycetaceae bacterium]HJM58739.1 hypothetical protein [Planctomycetota bacterium]